MTEEYSTMMIGELRSYIAAHPKPFVKFWADHRPDTVILTVAAYHENRVIKRTMHIDPQALMTANIDRKERDYRYEDFLRTLHRVVLLEIFGYYQEGV